MIKARHTGVQTNLAFMVKTPNQFEGVVHQWCQSCTAVEGALGTSAQAVDDSAHKAEWGGSVADVAGTPKRRRET